MTSKPDDRELLARLIAFDTTSHRSNLDLVAYLKERLERPGVRVEVHPSPEGTKANLLVRVGPRAGAGGEGLVLSGHMDVVPAGEGWTSDPFVLVERDGRLVARGACDMKGFLALAVGLVERLDLGSLVHPLVLLFTYDEEIGTLGSKHFARTWSSPEPLPRRVVVGEPTELKVLRMHKGHLKLRLSFRGRSAHSGYPDLGRNAIEAAAKAVLALGELGGSLRAEHPLHGEEFPDVPYAPLNVARITGGVAINVVPERAALEVGLRHLPGMRPDVLVERVRASVSERIPAADFDLELIGESPPMMAPPDGELLRAALGLPGVTAGPGASFATDAGWLGTLGMECVLFGPGSIQVAHRPDEYLPREELERARGYLESLVGLFCA